MVRLEDVVSKKTMMEIEKGAYARCFGDPDLALLLSRVQSLIIQNGNELENLITSEVEDRLIGDLDEFLEYQLMDEEGIRVAVKKVIKKSNKIEGHQIEPDFLIFEKRGRNQNSYIVELKDGHEFDTKSSAREHTNLTNFLSKNAHALQYFNSYIKIVGFNALSKVIIHEGMKKKFAFEQIMTGREFCTLLGLDFDRIVERRDDKAENFDNFVDELLKIQTVRDAIENRLLG